MAGCESIREPGPATGASGQPRPVSPGAGRARVVGLCLLGVAFNALLFGPSLQLTEKGVNDFMSIYSGTRLAFTGNMYNVEENLRVQREAAGWDNINHLFMRPPFDALFLWPLGRLPYLTATHIWEGLIVVSAVLFCFLWPGDRRTAALACCWSFPLFHVFANGQDVALMLVVIALGLREMQRGHDTLAGLIFSLCAIKFHLLLSLPILILGQRRWRFLGGLAIGGAVLFALSFLPGGWDWPTRYVALLQNPIGNPWPEAMPNIHGLVAGLVSGSPNSGLWQLAGSIAVAGVTWAACRKKSFEQGLAAVLVSGILIAPHAYLSDCAMAIPALLITLRSATGMQRNFHLFLMSPVCTIWAMVHPTWITTVALLAYLAMLGFLRERGDVSPKTTIELAYS